MTAEIRKLETTPGPGRMVTPQLRTLVVCDIADSTALVERMGDQNAANIIRKHDRLARALVERHQGREIDKTDGFLLLFDRPIQAAAFALDYQRGLKHLSAAEGVVVRARVGIHMGDVVIWENAPEDVARGAKPIEVEGLVKPVAARLAQLARPQQILMSSAAAGIAHRAEGELGAEAAQRVHWKDHGKYTFKGLPDPLEVVEVGEDEIAPLHAPKSGRTAKRVLPWWRRPLTLAGEAAVLAIGIGIGAWFVLQSPPTLAFGARDWVVVGDLHNLTGDKVFNQTVDSALRISLEQSQYVNVLPQLSVQQTLKRMDLNPAKADVNRTVGSQVALRDGARALILPTVADVDGRMNVTAEVIDPNTQATVYSISASGVGAQSVLDSLDSVSKQLRGKLGEALAQVSKQSLPLAKVATPDLNALRAYSLGEKYYSENKVDEALGYYREAIKIDPGFALDLVAISKVMASTGHIDQALAVLQKAIAIKGRLSRRDELYVDALYASYTGATNAVDQWKLLATVYPDYFPGIGAYAYFVWKDSNDFSLAEDIAQKAEVAVNPHRSTSWFLSGALLLGEDKYKESINAFDQASKGGINSSFFALPYAAERRFKDADAILARNQSSTASDGDAYAQLPYVAIAVDEGKFQDALDVIERAKRQDAAPGLDGGSTFDLMAASIDSMLGHTNGVVDGVKNLPTATRPPDSTAYPADAALQRLFGAYLAARTGDVALARSVMHDWEHDGHHANSPVLANMAGVVKAEILRVSGHPDEAIKVLEPLADNTALFITHVALRDAYATRGDMLGAMREATWLAGHRGRAYAEFAGQWVLVPFNVMQSNIALLDAAEYSVSQHRKVDAERFVQQFVLAWPKAGQIGVFKSRMQKVRAELNAD